MSSRYYIKYQHKNFCQSHTNINIILQDDNAILAIEVLKALFNLFIVPKDLKIETVEELEVYESMIIILRKLFLSENETHKENLAR